MKIFAVLLILLATTVVIASIVGQQVRSNAIRFSICEKVVEDQLEIQNDGLIAKLTKACKNDADITIAAEPILIPNINQNAKYKKKYGKFDVAYEFKNDGYYAKGTATAIRRIQTFLTDDGRELKGKYSWDVVKFDPDMKSVQFPKGNKLTILKELEEYLNEEQVENGNGSYIGAAHYKTSEFDIAKEIKTLHAEYNEDIENNGYEHIVEETSVKGIIEDGWFYNDSTLAAMLEPMKDNILGAAVVYPDDSEGACDESEYCSYIYYYIFFDNKVSDKPEGKG